MILSLNPPYTITPRILKLVSSISILVGEINANHLSRPSPLLRKTNRIKTIHASLQIEGNTLSIEQVTAIVENKRIAGPGKDVKEVLNAIQAYEMLETYKPFSGTSFLKAHHTLMKELVPNPGKYRTKGVGIVKGNLVKHIAPPAENIHYLMKDLFTYLKNAEELALIKSCVFHYELEFIHPFSDGNGRMGRLWQTLILMQEFPVFEFLPLETLIRKKQKEYYAALAKSDRAGHSTSFIEFMLSIMEGSLSETLQYKNRVMTEADRLEFFLAGASKEFSRKDYMNVFKDISSSTASRDLNKAIRLKLITASGIKNATRYTAS